MSATSSIGKTIEDNTGGIRALVDTFTSCVEPLGVQVSLVDGSAEAARLAAEFAAISESSDLVTSSELVGPAPNLISELAARSVQIEIAESLAATRDAPVGLSTARQAVAETGSLLLSEMSEGDRSVGLLALACMYVVPVSRLVPSLSDSVDTLRDVATSGPGYASFVTGPSRTADIELSLTIGVQGPARVAVVFVENLT